MWSKKFHSFSQRVFKMNPYWIQSPGIMTTLERTVIQIALCKKVQDFILPFEKENATLAKMSKWHSLRLHRHSHGIFLLKSPVIIYFWGLHSHWCHTVLQTEMKTQLKFQFVISEKVQHPRVCYHKLRQGRRCSRHFKISQNNAYCTLRYCFCSKAVLYCLISTKQYVQHINWLQDFTRTVSLNKQIKSDYADSLKKQFSVSFIGGERALNLVEVLVFRLNIDSTQNENSCL